MLNDAHLVAAILDCLSHLSFESRKPIDQRWHAAREADRIAETSARSAPAVGREIDNRNPFDQPFGKPLPGIGFTRLAENDQIDDVGAGQVVEE